MSDEPEPIAFDEDFVRGASFTEPSARERARRPGWRQRRRQRRGREPRESRLKTTATVVTVVVGLALVGGLAWRLRGGPSETKPVRHGPAPALSASDPFAGSPAAAYADGVAGIKPPTAAPVGGLGKRDVEAVYVRTSRLLTAAALDRPTLLGGSPDAFASALGPDGRSYFVKNLNNRDLDKRTRGWLVTFAPRTAELVGNRVKVDGTMSAHAATRQDVHGVNVNVDYLFVYAIQRPGQPRTLERLVARVSGEVFYYLRDGKLHQAMGDWSVAPTPARCDVHDGFVHPQYNDSPPDPKLKSGLPEDPYDRSHPLSPDGKCHLSRGT